MPTPRQLFTVFIALLFMPVLLAAQQTRLFVGTYTGTGSKGVYVYDFDNRTGNTKLLYNTDSAANPSFLATTVNSKFLYVVNEEEQGEVSAYKCDKITGGLKFINAVTTNGSHPCYLAISKDQRYVFVANYSSGNLLSYKIKNDGSLSEPDDNIQHYGSGPDKNRQARPHLHGVFLHPKQPAIFVTDLGTDVIRMYKLLIKKSQVIDSMHAVTIKVQPGAGPRHMAIDKNAKHMYVVEELTGTITVFRLVKNKYTQVQKISTREVNTQSAPASADIHISPDGKHLYATNRGNDNNIVQYQILPGGTLNATTVKFYASGGATPRNFTISNNGRWLLVANQGSNNIVLFKRDTLTGDLVNTGKKIVVPKPVCLLLN